MRKQVTNQHILLFSHLYSILAGDGGLSISMSCTMSPMATCLLVSSIIIMAETDSQENSSYRISTKDTSPAESHCLNFSVMGLCNEATLSNLYP